jgi:putative Holliday junction resolvase
VKYLAVDFGERRIGLATSDASGALASPRKTVLRTSDRRALEEIEDFARREEVEAVVVGLPHRGDSTESELAPRVRSFARKLEARLGLPVEFVNEHLTSREGRRKFGPGVEPDAAAAAIILEDFLLGQPR